MPIHIFVLTGAGISAESGLGTFRDKEGEGIWAKFDPMKLATPEGFARDPDAVLEFYDLRRRNLLNAKPNAAHFALARLEAALAANGGSLTLVTQNIDNLHERAGSARVVHMHGELLKARCGSCEAVHPWLDDLRGGARLSRLRPRRAFRPHVVWFGEMPLLHGRHLSRLGWSRSVRRDRHLGRRLPGGRIRRRGARVWIAHLRDQLGAVRQRGVVRRAAAMGRRARQFPTWVEELLRAP